MIKAPFTPEQVETLNAWQNLDHVHPFTCSCYPHDVLVATEKGWVCPKGEAGCGHEQNWAHEFMVDKKLWPLNPFEKLGD
jgi:hypothetical protein